MCESGLNCRSSRFCTKPDRTLGRGSRRRRSLNRSCADLARTSDELSRKGRLVQHDSKLFSENLGHVSSVTAEFACENVFAISLSSAAVKK